jgi:hypothetical protein
MTIFQSFKDEASNLTTSPERLRHLAEKNIRLARIVAKNPQTPVDLLRELSELDDRLTYKALVTNPSTPLDILFELGQKFLTDLLSNPLMTSMLNNPELLDTIPKNLIYNILKKRNFSCPQLFLDWAVKQTDENILSLALNKQNLSQENLEILAQCGENEIAKIAKIRLNKLLSE